MNKLFDTLVHPPMNTFRALVLVLLAGCGAMPVEDVRTTDAAVQDAVTADGRVQEAGVDVGRVEDGGADARTTAADVQDAATKDVGVQDVETTDAPVYDAGTTEPDVHDAGAAPDAGPALHVTLSWTGPGDTDLDLHLHNGTTTPWFNMTDDCFFSNPRSTWGAVLENDSRTTGPELLHAIPVIGMTYTIGVHHYGGPSRAATIEVACGGVSVFTLTSRVMVGFQELNCSPSDFWRVATVRFTAADTCVVNPIDTYSTSASACEMF